MKIMAGTLAVFILGCGSLYGQLRGSAELYQDTLKRVVLIVYQTDDSIVYRMPNEALFQVARAWELDSFLFKNGDAYYPLVVDDGKGARPKLLQQLAGGSKFSLFHLQEAGRFFIRDQGGRLRPISRDKAEARATLSQLAEGCAAVDHMTRLAEPKSLHLSVFVRNLDRCRYRLFPQPRVGVVGGAVLWRGKSLLPASMMAMHPEGPHGSIMAIPTWPGYSVKFH